MEQGRAAREFWMEFSVFDGEASQNLKHLEKSGRVEVKQKICSKHQCDNWQIQNREIFQQLLIDLTFWGKKHSGWFVFISWEKWVSAGQNGRKIWGGNNSSLLTLKKNFLENLPKTKSSVVNRAMFVYPKLTRAEVERVINTQDPHLKWKTSPQANHHKISLLWLI